MVVVVEFWPIQTGFERLSLPPVLNRTSSWPSTTPSGPSRSTNNWDPHVPTACHIAVRIQGTYRWLSDGFHENPICIFPNGLKSPWEHFPTLW